MTSQDGFDHDDAQHDADEPLDPLAVNPASKVIGELDAHDGIGVLGQNNAGSGSPIGVRGEVPNTGGGYGLATSDDARVDGTAELGGLGGSLTDGTVVTDLTGSGLSIDSGSLTASGSGTDTRTNVSDDGSTLVTDVEDIDFGSNLSVSDDGDNSVTVDASGGGGTDTRTDVSDDGSTVVTDVEDMDFGSNLSVSDDGDDSVTVDASGGGGTDTRTDVSENGSTVVTDTEDIDFHQNFTVSDSGGSVDVTIASSGINSAELGTGAVGTTELAMNAVTDSEVDAGAIDTDELATDAVTGSELASNAVDADELVTGAVGTGHLAQSGASDGHVLKWNGTTWETGFPGTTNQGNPLRLFAGGVHTVSLLSGGYNAPIVLIGRSISGAPGEGTTVSGGSDHTVGGTQTQGGNYATIPGGYNNTADGAYSFAAGRAADTNEQEGAFVFGDSSSSTIQAQGPDEVRSQMPIYAPSFNNTSTRTAKANVDSVDPGAVLEGVESLDVSTWEFADADDGRHMGPMAEDFHDTFELGDDEETIATVDAEGVALAAIQGLSSKLEEKEERIAEQADRIDNLEERLAALETGQLTIDAADD